MKYMSGFDKFIWANVFLTVVVMFLEMLSHVFSMASSDSGYKLVDGIRFTKDGNNAPFAYEHYDTNDSKF